MYKQIPPNKTTLNINQSYEGESIETKVNRIVNNKEPIKDGAPLIYTERKQGVLAEMNIRTDRWELAIDAMDKVNADKLAKREQRAAARELQAAEKLKGVIGETESTQGTDSTK